MTRPPRQRCEPGYESDPEFEVEPMRALEAKWTITRRSSGSRREDAAKAFAAQLIHSAL